MATRCFSALEEHEAPCKIQHAFPAAKLYGNSNKLKLETNQEEHSLW